MPAVPNDPLPLTFRDAQYVIEKGRFPLRHLPEVSQLRLKLVPTVIDTDGRDSTDAGHGDLH